MHKLFYFKICTTFENGILFFLLSSSLQRLTKSWFLSQWEKARVSLWMNYCIVQVQSARPLWGSVCKVILQSPEWLQTHWHITDMTHPCCGCSEKTSIYLHRKWRSPQLKALCVLTFIRKPELLNMAANSTNGLVYDRAAQIQRVSIQCIWDKRRLDVGCEAFN